jgi:hypothetical protein
VAQTEREQRQVEALLIPCISEYDAPRRCSDVGSGRVRNTRLDAPGKVEPSIILGTTREQITMRNPTTLLQPQAPPVAVLSGRCRRSGHIDTPHGRVDLDAPDRLFRHRG